MSLFEKFMPLLGMREILVRDDVNPVGLPFTKILSPTEAEVDGQAVVLAGTNNYLGLTFEAEMIKAAQDALARFGTGTTGSRMANGTYSEHLALERELADFFGLRSAITFTTGYQANVGVIATLAGPGDAILLDADSHASIYDAARMGSADTYRFQHNDPESLAKRLRRLGDRARRTLIIVEGIYSMLGDQAPLREIVAIKREYGGYLLVDEAHSLGVLGARGRGLTEALDVAADVDFIVGTFSKSLGCIGGYCVSDHLEMDLVRNAMRAYMFTASSTPATVATARAALAIIRRRPELQERLWRHARRLHAALLAMGLRLGAAPGPVAAVLVDAPEVAVEAWNLLLEQGIYVNLVIPPATPGNYALLRCSLSAAHTDTQIDRIIRAYGMVAEKLRASLQQAPDREVLVPASRR